MAYDPSLSTDRDALRFFLGDTNDAAPLFGLDEDGYDALITRFGLVNAAIVLIDRIIADLGPEMIVEGSKTEMTNRVYMFWMEKRKDVQNGALMPAGGAQGVAVATVAIAGPDLTNFKDL